MTDNEIKKALDILDRFDLFGGQRAGRELWNEKPVDVQNEDIENFVKNVVFIKDLINRLQAGKENLKDILYDDEGVNLVNYWHQQCKIAENGCKNFSEENKNLKAENERLKNILICFMGALGKVRNIDDIESISQIPIMTELNKGIRAEIKAEAYKECLEKIEQRDVSESDFYIMVKKTEFDNLLKEKVGDNDART